MALFSYGVITIERSKFNVDKDVTKRTFDNIVFDSVMEMKYYRDVLCSGLESGEISVVQLQKPYELQPKFVHNGKTVQPIKYVADFYVEYSDGHKEVIDIKGMADSVALLKRKLFWHTFPDIDYRWITYVKKYGGWQDYDVVKQLRRDEKRLKKLMVIELIILTVDLTFFMRS